VVFGKDDTQMGPAMAMDRRSINRCTHIRFHPYWTAKGIGWHIRPDSERFYSEETGSEKEISENEFFTALRRLQIYTGPGLISPEE
jgi:hypothetical protein